MKSGTGFGRSIKERTLMANKIASESQWADLVSKVKAKQNTLVSGTNIKTVNSTSLLGSGNVAVQPTLVSGTNIKTVNNVSLLGSGNLSIPVITVDSTLSSSSTNPVQNKVIYDAIGNVETVLQTLNSGSGV